jgi:hypothetical protein
MKVIANGQNIPFTISDEKNLFDLLSTLFMLTNKADKLIIECKVDGEVVSLTEKDKCIKRSLDSIGTIELILENKARKAVETLSEVEKIYPKLISECNEVSNYLLSGQKHKAMTVFSKCLNSWRKIINFLNIIEGAFGLKYSEIDVNGKKIDTATHELYDLLNEIKKAIQNDDVVTIGDLIEYELKAKIDEQKKIVAALEKILLENADKLKEQVQ